MIPFHANQFWWLSHELLRLEKEVGDSLTTGWSAEIGAAMAFAEGQCKAIELGDAAMLPLYSIRGTLQKFDLTGQYAIDIRQELRALRKAIEVELGKRGFAYVTAEDKKYFEQNRLFGDQVYNAFPSARFDLKEAGNCLACGINTAAGFHLMRAAEIGLWELGKDRQIPSAQGGKVEFSEWGRTIQALEVAIQQIAQWPNSAAKEDAHRFYNSSIVEIRAFNDGWRRHIAHVRKLQQPLTGDEVRALSGHVERFLKHLASRIAEGHYTPTIWT
jgi:hypothetical protein